MGYSIKYSGLLCHLTIIIVFVFLLPLGAIAQEANANTSSTPASSPSPSPTPIPLSSIIMETEKTENRLNEINQRISVQSSISQFQTYLSKLEEDVNIHEQNTNQLLASNPSLESLDKNESYWNSISLLLPSQKEKFQSEVETVSSLLAEIQNTKSIWNLTKESTEAAAKKSTDETSTQLSARVNTNVENIIKEINAAENNVQAILNELIKLQNELSNVEKKTESLISRISVTRKAILSNIAVKDSPPIWNKASFKANISQEAEKSFSGKFNLLKNYVAENPGNFLLHLFLVLILIFAFRRARQRTHQLIEKDAKLKKAFIIFEYPVISALMLGSLITPILYFRAPELLTLIISPVLVVSIFILFRQLLEKEYLPILAALVILYLINDLRILTDSISFLSRIIFRSRCSAAFFS